MGMVQKQPIEFNLWDGQVKPVEWYFSNSGKEAFLSTLENADEMNKAIDENNWISLIFNVCYQSSKKPLGTKLNWPIKFFYEYIISRYATRMATNENTLILLTKLAILKGDGCSQAFFPYPYCLEEEKNPILYYFSHVKGLFGSGYSEVSYPILKDIVHYIYNVFLKYFKDVSGESWMYDKLLYDDYRGKPNKYREAKAKLHELAEFSECLPN